MASPRWALIALTLLVGGLAHAAGEGVVATLAEPLPAKKELIIEGAMFRCESSTCVLVSHSDRAKLVDTCRALQHKVGPVLSYVVAGAPFEADRLAKCNAHG